MEKKRHIGKTILEIVLLVSISFSLSYFANRQNIVSAVTPADVVNTCLVSKNGAICQEYPSGDCLKNCTQTCLPNIRQNIDECKLGTCYDSVEGTCSLNSPKINCTNYNGKWFNEINDQNIAECKKGCCILGGGAAYSFDSEQQCTRKASVLGLTKQFKADIHSEISCLMQKTSLIEGACVFEKDGIKTCKFTTETNCYQMTLKRDNFIPGKLCSKTDLSTNCIKQNRTDCVEGKDEIYWFDSCGNRENIYEGSSAQQKEHSYNDGDVLLKEKACKLDSGTNYLANQRSCGNCNFLTGSKCMTKTSTERLSDPKQNVVCRSLSCTDSEGKKRKNGESFCIYQGSIGANEGRSTDTPGSRHFKATCNEGELKIDPCDEYRNNICIEQKTPLPAGDSLSTAACVVNRWQECIQINSEISQEDAESGAERFVDAKEDYKKAKEEYDEAKRHMEESSEQYNENDQRLKSAEERLEKAKGNLDVMQEKYQNKCTKNPSCVLKKVDVAKYFKFNLCVPKYPPGFDLNNIGEDEETLCNTASLTCKQIWVKKVSGWSCKVNCQCEDEEFGKQMNDLCISLGDCGTKVNYVGDLTENHRIIGSEELPQSYLNKLKKYSEPVRGKVAEVGSVKEYFESMGIPSNVGQPSEDEEESMFGGAEMIAGAVGGTMLAAAFIAPSSAIGAGAGSFFGSIPLVGGLIPEATSMSAASSPALVGLGGALAGGAIGLAVTSLLMKWLGINAGLAPAVQYALMAGGTVAGGLMGYNLATGAQLCAMGACWIAFVVILAIIVLKFLGIGKTREKEIQFKCMPWQAPLGGDKCSECSEGQKCSPYACHALGQTCKLVNTDSPGNEMCVDSNPDDVVAPVISPLDEALLDGFKYEKKTTDSVNLVGPEGCIGAFTQIQFGIELNEVGRCKYDITPGSYDEKDSLFGERNIFAKKHYANIIIPSLESLGLSSVDPNTKKDFNLYVRCEDARGNKNMKDYVINFCIKPGIDKTPLMIQKKLPATEYIKFGAINQTVSIYTNEPAECRWSNVSTDKYEEMKNNMTCANRISDATIFGWKCHDDLPVIQNVTNQYVRCLDQPWFKKPEEQVKRNSNQESYIVTIKKTLTKLNITKASPDNVTIPTGVTPMTQDLTAVTDGGVDGIADCSYSLDNGESYRRFSETNEKNHKNTFNQMVSGNYQWKIKCFDIAGNDAERSVNFTIDLDRTPPVVAWVFDRSDMLNIITNEESKCVFRNTILPELVNACDYDFINGSEMSNMGIVHSTELNSGVNYYIKCKDKFGNAPSGCSIVVRGGEY